MKRLLLSAAAMAIIAGPGVSLADPNHDHNDANHGAAAHQSGPAPSAPRQQQFRPSGPQSGGGMNQHQFQQHNFAAPAGGQPNFSRQPDYQGPGQRQWTQPRANPGYVQSSHQNTWNRNGVPQGQNTWNRNAQGQNTWNRNGGRGQDWWRGQRGFERYEGRRDGYWFAPGWGYYRPNPEWYDYDWSVGALVPYELWSYNVGDPYDYGLQAAPYGYRWIYLDNQMVLIDLSTGEIVQVAGDY